MSTHRHDAGDPLPIETIPIRPDASWQFLGFDVSDQYLLSGLSNCGYTDAELPRLRQDWQHHLNDHHLFDNLAAAGDFRELTDAQVSATRRFLSMACGA